MKREISIDALRGIAIIGMILSGTISHNAELPNWFFHAQVGPPDFTFHPEIPGLTWVDLVFPFFLFAMGLAFPFSLANQLEKGISKTTIIKKVFFRSMKLFLFAIIIAHMSPYRWAGEVSIWTWVLAISTFFALFLTFSKFYFTKISEQTLNIIGYTMLLILLILKSVIFKQAFSIHQNDIIILVLANMALFGAVIWIFTPENWFPRLGILAFYLALRLSASIPDTFNADIWNFTFFNFLGNTIPDLKIWLQEFGIFTDKTVYYSLNFIKYLFIVIPGSIVGDILYNAIKKGDNLKLFSESETKKVHWGIILFMLFIVIFAQVSLQDRWGYSVPVWNLFFVLILFFSVKKIKNTLPKAVINIINWSIFWFAVGILFEPFEGGIKKDHATLSYFFVTIGLSGFLLLVFKAIFDAKLFFTKLELLPSIGKNPMLAYVVVTFFIMPIFYTIGLSSWMSTWQNTNPYLGILNGLIYTILMIWLTRISVKYKFFWKT